MCLIVSHPKPSDIYTIRQFVVIPHQADWLFNCWHLGSLDVIQVAVTLVSGSTSATG